MNEMQLREFILEQHARLHSASVAGGQPSYQDRMLKDVTPELFRTQPDGGFCSLNWLLWHMTRIEDAAVSIILAREDQVLETERWQDRLGPIPTSLGTAMSETDASGLAANVDMDGLIGYRAAVGANTQRIVRALNMAALADVVSTEDIAHLSSQNALQGGSEVIGGRWLGLKKSYMLQHSVLAHSAMHFGQSEDTRMLLGLTTV